jgi:hypothetical protein
VREGISDKSHFSDDQEGPEQATCDSEEGGANERTANSWIPEFEEPFDLGAEGGFHYFANFGGMGRFCQE